jgi:hypothetical protein
MGNRGLSREQALRAPHERKPGVLAALERADPFDVYDLATGPAWSVQERIVMLHEIVPGALISAGDGKIERPGGIDTR